jgi:hypothetical protein
VIFWFEKKPSGNPGWSGKPKNETQSHVSISDYEGAEKMYDFVKIVFVSCVETRRHSSRLFIIINTKRCTFYIFSSPARPSHLPLQHPPTLPPPVPRHTPLLSGNKRKLGILYLYGSKLSVLMMNLHRRQLSLAFIGFKSFFKLGFDSIQGCQIFLVQPTTAG